MVWFSNVYMKTLGIDKPARAIGLLNSLTKELLKDNYK